MSEYGQCDGGGEHSGVATDPAMYVPGYTGDDSMYGAACYADPPWAVAMVEDVGPVVLGDELFAACVEYFVAGFVLVAMFRLVGLGCREIIRLVKGR